MRKKTSVIWMLPTDELRELVNNSKTMSEVLGFFGLRNRGSNYRTMTQRLRQEGIDWSKFKENWGHGQIKPLRPLEEILVEHSTYTNSSCLKRRLIKEGVLENKCVLCGLGPIWNGKPLSLTLDHENGTSDDNRRENLRILCPNCHSQTPTFAGKRHKKTKPLADRHRPRLSGPQCAAAGGDRTAVHASPPHRSFDR
jgi:hypothetical protein